MTRPLLALSVGLAGAPVQLTVDRIEGDLAVIELGRDDFTALPLSLLPPGLAEGDALLFRRSAARIRIRRCRTWRRPPQPKPSRPAHFRAPRRTVATHTGEPT